MSGTNSARNDRVKPPAGNLLLSPATAIVGDVRNCRRLDLYGSIDGEVVADDVVVHRGGRLSGRLRAGTAVIHGAVEGDIEIRNLVTISATGVVTGDLRYGRMSLEPGGELVAKVKNMPPELAGDFEISVVRGQHVVLTRADLYAIDPDNTAAELKFSVSGLKGGHIAEVGTLATSITTFTQHDVDNGRIAFVHDGSSDRRGSFDAVVTDAAGATSGKPRTIAVSVNASRPA